MFVIFFVSKEGFAPDPMPSHGGSVSQHFKMAAGKLPSNALSLKQVTATSDELLCYAKKLLVDLMIVCFFPFEVLS